MKHYKNKSMACTAILQVKRSIVQIQVRLLHLYQDRRDSENYFQHNKRFCLIYCSLKISENPKIFHFIAFNAENFRESLQTYEQVETIFIIHSKRASSTKNGLNLMLCIIFLWRDQISLLKRQWQLNEPETLKTWISSNKQDPHFLTQSVPDSVIKLGLYVQYL